MKYVLRLFEVAGRPSAEQFVYSWSMLYFCQNNKKNRSLSKWKIGSQSLFFVEKQIFESEDMQLVKKIK